MRLLFLLLAICFTAPLFAQGGFTVKGSVKDTSNAPVAGATVSLISESKDTVRNVTDNKGEFRFDNRPSAAFTLLVEAVSAKPFKEKFSFEGESRIINIRNIVLTPNSHVLQAVVVSTAKSIIIKEDTISYAADSFAVRPNAVVEDLLKKLPGVEVDKAGNVTAQGKSVTKVKVNGKDFFNGDMKTATKELPADIIDRVDIIDDYGDQATFTGVKDGEAQKVLNLQIKKDKNKGYFGNASVGKGTVGRYIASLSAFRFNNNEQLSLITNLNNTNTDMFSFNVPGIGGGGMGGGRIGGSSSASPSGGNGGGNNSNANNNSSNTNGTNGLSDTKSIGLNYRNNISKKITLYGSYMFTHKATDVISNSTQQNLFGTGSYNTYQNSTQNTIGNNHRLSLNLEYNIDSSNYLKVSPSFAYRTTNDVTASSSVSELVNQYTTTSALANYTTKATAPTFSGSILYNHKFAKKGRNFSLNYSGNSVTTDQTNRNETETAYYDSLSGQNIINQYRTITQQNSSNSYNVRLSYTEPISKTQSLEFNYSYGKSVVANDKAVYNTDSVSAKNTFIDSLSNYYENLYYTNRFGINFRGTQKRYNYSVGMAVQPALVKSNTKIVAYNYNLFNYMPTARFVYNFSRSRSFDINYSGRTSQPTYDQLQPVVDNSNPLYITVGNPDLKPEFSNTLNVHYNNYDIAHGNVFFSNLSYTSTSNKIVTNAINTAPGMQEIHYLNNNGYYSLNGFYFFSKPFQNRRYVLNLNGNASYYNNISYINSERNVGRNLILNQSVKGTVNVNWMEFGTSAAYSYNRIRYTLAGQQSTDVKTITLSSDARFYLPGNFVLSYDVQKILNRGYTSGVVTDPFLVNGYIEKKFLKKSNGSIKLQAFDLLNQNANVSRTVTNNVITDTYSNRLGRYYLLTFALRLSKFGGASVNGMQHMGPPPGGPMF